MIRLKKRDIKKMLKYGAKLSGEMCIRDRTVDRHLQSTLSYSFVLILLLN